MNPIFHVVPLAQWEACRDAGLYRPPSLVADGFIHGSTADQLAATLALHFGPASAAAAAGDLLLVCIDAERVRVPVRNEAAASGRPGERLPHLYGPLNLDAVVDILPLRRGEGGAVELPPEFARLR